MLKYTLFFLLLPVTMLGSELQIKIDSIAKNYLLVANKASLVIGIYDKGESANYFYGDRSDGMKKLPDGNTYYEIGSITKSMTGMMVSKFIEEGKINPNESIYEYLPDSINVSKPDAENITVKYLLNHASGLPKLPSNIMPKMTDYKNPYKSYNRADVVQYLYDPDFNNKPGEKYEYSNIGYAILGLAIEHVSGKNYEELIREIIFEPAGMDNSTLDISDTMRYNLAYPWDMMGQRAKNWELNAHDPAGGVVSNLSDMMNFLLFNLDSDEEYVTKSHRADFPTGSNNGMVGYGWHSFDVAGKKLIWHNGGTGGYRTFIGFIPEIDAGVVVMASSAISVDQMAIDILKILSSE
jgi:CubicO group peptidase (beta-lactamase class C family)